MIKEALLWVMVVVLSTIGLVSFGMHVLSNDDAMRVCQIDHSHETCHAALYR